MNLDLFQRYTSHSPYIAKLYFQELLTKKSRIFDKFTLCRTSKMLYGVKIVQMRSFVSSLFSRTRTEYGYLRNESPYSVRIRENTYLDTFP